MAGFEQEAFEALRDMLAATSTEAIPAAEDAAAKVYLQAARAAAPVDSGQLRASIKIIESKNKAALTVESGGGTRRRLFVGPEKKKGYYGFFLEKGHKTAGPHRVKRRASGNTHSQSGVSAQRMIPAKPWFEPAIQGADSAATSAAESAFNSKLQELNGRK
jgi:hypothetical protein